MPDEPPTKSITAKLSELIMPMVENAILAGDPQTSEAYIGSALMIVRKLNTIKPHVFRKAVSNLQALPGNNTLEEKSIVSICERVADLCEALQAARDDS